MGSFVLGLTCAAALLVSSCAHQKTTYTVVSPPRDWAAHPAIVTADATPADLYAVSDPHGGYDRLVGVLVGAGVLAAAPVTPSDPVWRAGGATLVVVGDLFDKGPMAVEILEMLMALEPRAAAAGGRVVVLVGNHEAEFFADPGNTKADGSDGVDHELRAQGVDPVAVASGQDARGQWLRDRPFGAKLGAWFFAHAGDTHGRTVADLETMLRAAVDAHRDYDDAALIAGDSLLESRDWYGDPSVAPRYAASLGVAHIVFGHDPNALGDKGAMATAQNGMLFRVDCGMSPDVDYSTGRALHVHMDGASAVADEIDPNGQVRELWRGAP